MARRESCLRRGAPSPSLGQLPNRSVSFPDDETRIVTGYLEPANPWQYAESTSKDAVIASYIGSCDKHGTRPIASIVEQLQMLDVGKERCDSLSLKGEPLVTASCEALEEILKRIQFVKLNLEATGLDDEAAVVLFDMIEYYEAATQLNISSNNGIGVRGWQSCSRMLKKTKCLEQLECRNTALSEQHMPILSKALRLGTQLQVLRLENCSLGGRSTVILVAALKLNSGLKELYLAENYLSSNDAMQLAALLKCNSTLQLLDISNNNIEDNGLSHLCEGLAEQSKPGLNILVVWNNHLTPVSTHHLAKALAKNETLEMLNIGHNNLGNDLFHVTKESLLQNRTLLRLGLQATQVTCEGAVALAEIIEDNPVIQRIDLRDNKLEIAGLMALALSMKENTSITQLDLDDRPRNRHSLGDNLEKYMELVDEIRGYCGRNDSLGKEGQVREKMSQMAARKISLTCDTLMQQRALTASTSASIAGCHLLQEPRKSTRLRSPAPSPIPSPVASPSPTRTRFQVSKVSEDSPPDSMFFGGGGGGGSSNSRFKVTPVEPTVSVVLASDTKKETIIVPPDMVKRPEAVPKREEKLKTIEETNDRKAVPEAPTKSGSAARKLSSWVPPTSLFSENKAVERLLGLFQNPFGRHQQQTTVASSSVLQTSNVPEICDREPPSSSSTTPASVPEPTPGLDLPTDIINNNNDAEIGTSSSSSSPPSSSSDAGQGINSITLSL